MTMSHTINRSPSLFLRRALLADAALSGVTGLLLIVGADVLAGVLALPAALLREAGLVLVPYVAFVFYLGMRARVPRAAVMTVIAANAVWAAASIGLLFTCWVAPNMLGTTFVIAQAAVVAILGEWQAVALRR